MKRMITAILAGSLCLSATLLLAVGKPDPKGNPDAAVIVKGNSTFACDLYGQLRGKEGNLFFSPFSISSALAMTSNGARGQTAEQMAKTLHFTLESKKLDPAFAALVKELNGNGKPRGYQLAVANALWGQKGYHFLPEFLAATKDNYGAGLNPVDFKGATEEARKTINSWVEKQTQDKIKELLKPGILDDQTRLVLTNAIYFKGDWASKFKKEKTSDEVFHLSAGKKDKVLMMHQTQKFGLLETETLQALEMPYIGKELSMIVLLPKKVDGLADLEKSLTSAKLDEWMPKKGRDVEVEVSMPKFKATSEFQLNDSLMALGMTDAFSDKANFSGINGELDLFIKAVVHKAFVDVNEEGSEAAAATAVVVNLKTDSARIMRTFRADHPFVFLIRDNRSGSILFMGRVVNPNG